MELQINSWREALFIASELNDLFYMNIYDDVKESRSIEHATDDIYNAIEVIKLDDISSKTNIKVNKFDGVASSIIKYLKNEFTDKQQLPKDEFEWIKNDPKTCAFINHFLYINSGEIYDYKSDSIRIKDTQLPLVYSKYPLSLHRFLNSRDRIRLPYIRKRQALFGNHLERFNAIVTAFKYSEINLDGQIYILKLLKEAVAEIFSNKENATFKNWLNFEDEKQIDWLVSYLKKQDSLRMPWKPINIKEKYLAVIADFDYQFLINPKQTGLIFNKVRQAWNQRKFQNKTDGTKSRSISMTKRTRERLDSLAKEKDIKINAVIKELIDKEYEALQKKP